MKKVLFGLAVALTALTAGQAPAQTTTPATARDYEGPPALVPLDSQPPAHLIVDQPQADVLKLGVVVIQYHAENCRIVPVYGPNAVPVTPRLCHLHVTIDGAPWHWADASNQPIILVGLPAGPHKVELVLADPTHRPIEKHMVEFVVPAVEPMHMH